MTARGLAMTKKRAQFAGVNNLCGSPDLKKGFAMYWNAGLRAGVG